MAMYPVNLGYNKYLMSPDSATGLPRIAWVVNRKLKKLYVGQISNHVPHGLGTFYGSDRVTVLKRGVFVLGKFLYEDHSIFERLSCRSEHEKKEKSAEFELSPELLYRFSVGDLKKGTLEGKGILFENGSLWIGIFEGGHLIEGEATLWNGEIVTGKFSNGKLAEGRIVFPHGEIQEGIFENGILVNGKMTFPDGWMEIGKRVDGILTKGTIITPDKMISEGTFEGGELVQGQITYPNGRVVQLPKKTNLH